VAESNPHGVSNGHYRDEFVGELINQTKQNWKANWAALPDEQRLRLSGMIDPIGREHLKLATGYGGGFRRAACRRPGTLAHTAAEMPSFHEAEISTSRTE